MESDLELSTTLTRNSSLKRNSCNAPALQSLTRLYPDLSAMVMYSMAPSV
jgi:hypothetical protein